jgi:hypothetical protein
MLQVDLTQNGVDISFRSTKMQIRRFVYSNNRKFEYEVVDSIRCTYMKLKIKYNTILSWFIIKRRL